MKRINRNATSLFGGALKCCQELSLGATSSANVVPDSTKALAKPVAHEFTNTLAVLYLLVGGVLWTVGCAPGPVAAPTAYVEFNHKEGTFACEYPDGWEADGGGKNGPIWATFQSGPAEIRLSGDVAGSMMGDAMGGRHQSDQPLELQPVHLIHVSDMESAQDKYPGYTEIGQPKELDVPLGPARVSEFTATTTFGSGLHGYRLTVLGHNKRVTGFLICPESDWQTLQPAFDHVLGSLKRGMAE